MSDAPPKKAVVLLSGGLDSSSIVGLVRKEFRYELDRNDTHRMLIRMLLDDRRTNASVDAMVRRSLDRAAHALESARAPSSRSTVRCLRSIWPVIRFGTRSTISTGVVSSLNSPAAMEYQNAAATSASSSVSGCAGPSFSCSALPMRPCSAAFVRR